MKQIFINLPVKDPERSKNFYSQLGFTNYPLFTGDNQVCMAWDENILVMLQTKEFFNAGNGKSTANTANMLSATFTIPVETIDELNKIIETGLTAGGREPIPMVDEGFMQVRSIEDLDGHVWGVICLDVENFRRLKGI